MTLDIKGESLLCIFYSSSLLQSLERFVIQVVAPGFSLLSFLCLTSTREIFTHTERHSGP